MFIQPCFIRKKTQELIDKIVAMGYHYPMKYHEISPNLLTMPYRGHGWGTLISVENKLIDLALKTQTNQKPTIDCKTNEKLFLALAALRDDTDKYHWFFQQDGQLIMCDQNTLEHFAYVNNSQNSYSRDIWKKATVTDLINHFK